MPWVAVWLHFVWSTKERYPYLTNEIREKVFSHIQANAKNKGINLLFINGYVDHVHCLVFMGMDQTIENIMKLIKGESSYWINKNRLTKARFEWQDEYFVASVSESNLASVRKYIANQEEHHKKVSFEDEFNRFLMMTGFQRMKDAG